MQCSLHIVEKNLCLY